MELHNSRLDARLAKSHGQSGATLLLILLFVFILLTTLLALLNMAEANSDSIHAYRADRAIHFAADAALEEEIQDLVFNPTYNGVSGCGPGLSDIPLDPPNGALHVGGVTSSSTLKVTCAATAGVTIPPGGIDPSDGGQALRDLTLTVTCLTSGLSDAAHPHEYQCGSGTLRNDYIATARVQFYPDYTAVDRTKRSVIPKVVAWTIYRN